MNKKTFIPASLSALLMLVLTFGIALAHTGIKAGNYEIEVGWQDEPAVVGQRNAVIINATDTTNKDTVVDISKLQVSITYGGQTKTLTLQPLGEDTKNQYIAPLIPSVAGEYTLQLRGKLGDTEVNADTALDEISGTDTLSFPAVPAQTQSAAMRPTDFIGIGALVIGLAALVLALRKSRA